MYGIYGASGRHPLQVPCQHVWYMVLVVDIHYEFLTNMYGIYGASGRHPLQVPCQHVWYIWC